MKCKHCGKEIANDSVFCEFCGTKVSVGPEQKASEKNIDGVLLNIIEVSSHNNNILAAFNARSKCYRLCKKISLRPDYKEYVQHLQLENYPAEFHKSLFGCWFLVFLCIGILAAIVLSLGIIMISDGTEEVGLWFVLFAPAVLGCSVWFTVRKKKQTKIAIKELEINQQALSHNKK